MNFVWINEKTKKAAIKNSRKNIEYTTHSGIEGTNSILF